MRRTFTGASIMGALILALAAVSLSAEPAQAQRIRAGVLNCDVSAGIGLIIGSQRSVNCLFTPDQGGQQEGYFGTISKLGLDIGITAGGVMVWGVYVDTSRGYGFLAGDYAGASGEVTIAAGLGANVLIGGFIVTGNIAKPLMLRGMGPSLAGSGLPADQVLEDPVLELHGANGASGRGGARVQ
jgi:hypothetical protein